MWGAHTKESSAKLAGGLKKKEGTKVKEGRSVRGNSDQRAGLLNRGGAWMGKKL